MFFTTINEYIITNFQYSIGNNKVVVDIIRTTVLHDITDIFFMIYITTEHTYNLIVKHCVLDSANHF